jgi:hypothetical protein
MRPRLRQRRDEVGKSEKPSWAVFFPNGSAHDRPLTEFLEAHQHGQHPFKLAVEVNLVAAKPLQLVWVERLTERLLADEWPVPQFLLAHLEPRQHLTFKEATQALDVGGGGLLKGAAGDAANAILTAVGHNLRLVLAWLRILLRLILAALWRALVDHPRLKLDC